jgi:choline dehydrogenase
MRKCLLLLQISLGLAMFHYSLLRLLAIEGFLGRLFVAAAPTSPADLVFDYIVVGSGAGGGVVASRLARAGHSTLLIESGDDQGANLNATVPALFAAVAEDPKLAWDYYINHYSNETKQQEDGKFVWNTGADLHVGPDPPAGSKPLGIQYVRAVYHRRYKASR